MNKVVYNNGFGGFSLSQAALRTLKKQGVPVNEYSGKLYLDNEVARHDPRLVAIVEQMGDAADGECASLKVVEVGPMYRIDEYDGAETVVQPGGDVWITIPEGGVQA